MKIKENFKRFIAGTLCLTTFTMFQPNLPAYAEQESEEFQYTMFASSNEDGAITVNASNFTINGQIATNGTVNCSGNTNINYNNSNNVCVDMVYIPNKIDSDFFDGRDIDSVADDYSIEDTNINISSPLNVDGSTTMQGNVTIQAGVKSKDDINISCDVKNSYDTVIYSQYGDITIDCNNVSLNGLIYAPFGTIHITATNINLNDTMIIANKIIIDAPNVNVNYSEHFGSYFNEVSDKMEIPVEDFIYLDDDNDNGIPDFFENSINWKYINDTDGDGVPDIIEVNTGTDPNNPDGDVSDILDGYTLEMMYNKNPLLIWSDESNSLKLYGDLNDDLIIDAFDLVLMRQMVINNNYSKYADLDDDADIDAEDLNWLSNYLLLKVKSFPVYNKFDSDNDGLTDYVEVENYGTSPHKADTDDDGLNDYFELFLMKTDPLIPDNIAGEDPDNDGLTNAQESKYNTDPYSDDTDEDGLTDWKELKAIGTEPLLPDTDGDGLTDYDEVEALYALDPLNPNTNGTPDGKRIIKQIISEDAPLLSEVNTEDNAYALSIEINSSGNAKRLLNVEKSGYYNVMKDGSAVGFIPEFSYPDAYDVESITLNFRIKDGYKDNVMNIFAEEGYITNNEFKGVKRFTIFKYFEDIDIQMPIENACTIIGDTVSVTLPKESFEEDFAYSVHNIGSYSLVDLEVWGMMMNNNLMSDDDIETLSNIKNTPIASVSNDVSDDYGISTYGLLDDVENNISNILKNYSKSSSKTNSTNLDVHIINGHVYSIIEDKGVSYRTAKDKCKEMDGHLVSPNSENEINAIIHTITPGNTTNRYWIGAYRSDGKWFLVDSDDDDSNDIIACTLQNYQVTIGGRKYTVKDFSGTYLYYADGLSYTTGVTTIGYICEWDSYAKYLNYLKKSAREDPNKEVVSSFFGNFVLNGLLSKDSKTDTDEDGVYDYDELNKKLLNNVNKNRPDSLTVRYLDIINYLSSSSKAKSLVSSYSTNSKVNKILNYTMVTTTSSSQNPGTTTTVVGTAPIVTSPVSPTTLAIVDPDPDKDYLIGKDDEDKPNKFNPTPVDMNLLNDEDMLTVKPEIDKSKEEAIGGGENKLMHMPGGYDKVYTIYQRDSNHDRVEFLLEESKLTASCLIVEISFENSTIRDNIYKDDKNFLEFSTKYLKNYSNIVSVESVDIDGKSCIRYTIEVSHLNHYNGKYKISINDKNPNIGNTTFSIKFYEESYVYAPNGGVVFKDRVRFDNGVDLVDYKALYFDEKSFKTIGKYEGMVGLWGEHIAKSSIAEIISDNIIDSNLSDYENFKEFVAEIGNSMTMLGTPLLLFNFPGTASNEIAWTLLGSAVTILGAESYLALSFNNVSKESLKEELRNLLYDNEFNVYIYSTKIADGSYNYFKSHWLGWDGIYIRRVLGDSVLYKSVNLNGYDVNTNEIFNLDDINNHTN